MVGQQPVLGGLPLELVEVRDVPPGQECGQGAADPDQRPPGGQHHVAGCADAVVGGGVTVAGGGELHMLARRLPGPPVRGDDGLALRTAVRQVGVGRAGGLGDLRLSARVLRAQRQYAGVVLAVYVIG